MKKLYITKIKSTIGSTQRVKRTMEALGLKKINQVVVHPNTAPIQGMVRKVNHLVHYTLERK